MKKTIALILIIIFILSTGVGCQSSEKEESLVVGMELAYPPFETKDEQGNPIGISVDFAKELGEYLGKPTIIENISWDGLITSLQTGKIDLVISSMTIKEERLEKIDFSKPYAKALLAILANKESQIKTIEDLDKQGKKIAVKLGSTGHIYAENNFENTEIITLADESACVTEVVQGKVDGFIYDQLTILRNSKANPETTEAIFIPFQEVEYWGVGVKKRNEELLNQVNNFIDDFYERDGFEPLTQKYLSEEKAAFDELGFGWFFDDVNE